MHESQGTESLLCDLQIKRRRSRFKSSTSGVLMPRNMLPAESRQSPTAAPSPTPCAARTLDICASHQISEEVRIQGFGLTSLLLFLSEGSLR